MSEPVEKQIYYLESILRQLQQLRNVCNELEPSPSIGNEVLADNIDWLDCHIDSLKKEQASLKLCPFCKGSAQLLCGGAGNWFVRCTQCKCTTNDMHRDRAVELWNTRQ